MEANAGESFQMQILFNIFPRISLHSELRSSSPILRIRINSIVPIYELSFENVSYVSCLVANSVKTVTHFILIPKTKTSGAGPAVSYSENR